MLGEPVSDEYLDGHEDGYEGNGYHNPYNELSFSWCQYDKGYDDGMKAWQRMLEENDK